LNGVGLRLPEPTTRRFGVPKAAKASASKVQELPGFVSDRAEELGGFTVNFTEFHRDLDGASLLRGAPNDQCQCPHWGYVLKGKTGFRFSDREEIYEAGDAFYVGAGHTPLAFDGSEVLMFSPTEELAATQAVMAQNMEDMQRSAGTADG
jgi:hypothetical protein